MYLPRTNERRVGGGDRYNIDSENFTIYYWLVDQD